MPDSYKELIKSNPDETEIRSFLVNGDQVSVTLAHPRHPARRGEGGGGPARHELLRLRAHLHDRRAREEGGVSMIRVKTLTVQLIDAQPDRIRICRIDGESLVTVVVPREDLAEAKSLPNIPQRGVYYLLDEDHGNVSRVYAGQTTQGIARLDAHKAKKEFWNKAVMFLDDDQNISRDALDVLEAKAIDYVRTHGSYETDNSATPKPYVDPYKEEAVERLHERILFRMAALGYDLDRVDQGPAGAPAVFHTKKNGIRGAGRYDKATGHFTVLAGSKVNLSRPVLKNAAVAAARREIFGDSGGIAELAEDLEFPTPSAAAVFVLGGSQNGWTEWVSDDGETLNEVYRSEEN